MGGKLKTLLSRELESHPLVGDIRGRGLFWAVEFVLDKDLKTPLPLKAKFSSRAVKNSLDLGLNILGSLGHRKIPSRSYSSLSARHRNR